MSRIVFVFCLFLFWSFACPANLCANEPKPNIVIFFVDDLGFTDINCFRALHTESVPFYETPKIDELCSRGAIFSQFYSAHPVCSPTRAALMTGKVPQRLGITQWIPQTSKVHLPVKEITIGEAFQEAGYETGYIGKWHLGHEDQHQPEHQGFTWTRCVNRAGQPASYFHPFKRKPRNGSTYWDVPNLEQARSGDYLTDKMTDHALDFIKGNRDKKFFLCFSHYAVHTPIQSPSDLVDKYRKKRQVHIDSEQREFHTDELNSLTRQVQSDAKYAAMIENLDHNVGRVVEMLEQLNLTERTIIVFTSDNGGLTTLKKQRKAPTSVKPFRAGKGWCYEGGIRVPTSIIWPKQIQPQRVDLPAITMDLYPTLLELAGIERRPKQHLDGISLAPSLRDESELQSESESESERESEREFLAWTYPHRHGSGHTPSHAIRQGKWKLVSRLAPANSIELYDLESDISETTDLARKHPAVAKHLSALLDGWLKETTTSTSK